MDIVTEEPLFLSVDKFDSGCGWPGFAKPIDPAVIETYADTSHDMTRTEVRSRGGDTHLGHVLEDGPEELGVSVTVLTARLYALFLIRKWRPADMAG